MINQLYDCFKHWSEKGSVYLISDTHFGDTELQAALNRPSSEEIVERINKKVSKSDCLICLGDVGDLSYVRKLKAGYKVLIQGNHDAGASNYKRNAATYRLNINDYIIDTFGSLDEFDYSELFTPSLNRVNAAYQYLYDRESKRLDFVSMSQLFDTMSKPYFSCDVKYDNKLFDEVYSGPLIVGEKLLLSHEPIYTPCFFNIHGHEHNFKETDSKHLNVCCDVIDYTPVSLKAIILSGVLKNIDSIHRQTIDNATERKNKRLNK